MGLRALVLLHFCLDFSLSWEDISKNCKTFLQRVIPPSLGDGENPEHLSKLCMRTRTHGQAQKRWRQRKMWSSVMGLLTHSSEQQLLLVLGRGVLSSLEYGSGVRPGTSTCHKSQHLKWTELSKQARVKSGFDVSCSVWLEQGSSCNFCFHCLSVWVVKSIYFVAGSNQRRWRRVPHHL